MSTPDDSLRSLPRRTAPTWEVELLISGVAVFAMLQLPGWLDARAFALEPQVSDDWRIVLLMSYFYAKSAAIVLAVTFAVHLLLRAQWIALVGMHSVYPQGVRLSRLRMGPIQRAIEENRSEHMPDVIERADNRASVVFAIGVSVALVIATVCIFFCGSLLLATLLSQALDWGLEPLNMIATVCALVIGPFAAATLIDRGFGARLHPDGLPYRATHAVLRFYTWIGMGRRNNQIIAILTSNSGERRMMALVLGIMLAAIIGVSSAYAAMARATALGSYGLFPSEHEASLEPAHYDDQRSPGRDAALPYLQSAVITGPYLKLVVPYRPDRDEPALRRSCPQGQAARGQADHEARRACLQALHGVALDGKPVANLHYEVASDPRTDRPALLAMIDVRELPRGRHELRVARPAHGDQKANKDDPDPGFDAIPFWR